jgi:hypothetical protein
VASGSGQKFHYKLAQVTTLRGRYLSGMHRRVVVPLIPKGTFVLGVIG